MKDNFSIQSEQYARYRPTYPTELFEYIRSICAGFQYAWDCGTGNGQVAAALAEMFDKVYATDISQAQLNNAVQKSNIHYSLQPAEATNFPPHFFNLVMAGQAVHWFQFEKFYAEVTRSCRKDGVIVIVGYGKFSCTTEIDQLVNDFNENILARYWDGERKYIDEHYKTIPFPFEELPAPSFKNEYEWTFEQLMGYLETWSAVKHYTRQHGESPVRLICRKLEQCWGTAKIRTISFPLLVRAGKLRN